MPSSGRILKVVSRTTDEPGMRRTCRNAAGIPTRPTHHRMNPRDHGTSIIEVIKKHGGGE